MSRPALAAAYGAVFVAKNALINAQTFLEGADRNLFTDRLEALQEEVRKLGRDMARECGL